MARRCVSPRDHMNRNVRASRRISSCGSERPQQLVEKSGAGTAYHDLRGILELREAQ